MPSSNAPKWTEKFNKNRVRDIKASAELEALGWKVLVIWECETRSIESITAKINQATSPRLEHNAGYLDKGGQERDKSKKGGS